MLTICDQYASRHHLIFNPTKTKCMFFPTNKNMKQCPYLTRCTRGDARSFFSVLTKRICMHKTKFLMNVFKYCFKNYIKLHKFANCNSSNYDV